MSEVRKLRRNRDAARIELDPKSRTIFGWCMYDWANSAYVTTVVAGILPAYFAGVVVGSDGVSFAGFRTSAIALWGFTTSLAAFLSFLMAPILGAIADFSATKKRFLLSFAYGGALFTLLLWFCGSGDVIPTLLLFLLAQVGFIGANVFYDAFLPAIASPAEMDRISGKGYSFGYLGGGIQFALSLVLIAAHDTFGLSQTTAAKVALLMAGLWWAGFTLFTLKYLKEKPSTATVPEKYRSWPKPLAYAAIGVSRTWKTARHVGRYRHLVIFLVGFMLYNDGIETVILMATIYGTAELQLSTTALMVTLLLIQLVGVFGALAFTKIAARTGTKVAIMISLVLWSGVVVYAYFITTAAEYFALGAVVGIVLGGSQALSRSFYGSMVPLEASAEFFGFYTVFSKFSAIWGPSVFGIITQWTGSSRLAILSLVVFFIAGLILLALVDEREARRAREESAFL